MIWGLYVGHLSRIESYGHSGNHHATTSGFDRVTMVTILYTFDRGFMHKTFRAVDKHVDVPSAILPLGPEAGDCHGPIPVIERPLASAADLDVAVAEIDPAIVVQNHRFSTEVLDEQPTFHQEYPVVHIRHGASLGRGEQWQTTRDLGDVVDLALAPGRQWAAHYRREFPDDVAVRVVGIPEADALVETAPPRQRRVLYAPTNHNYGGGCYLKTATDVLETLGNTEYDVRFRPHPHDRVEEPGRTLTEQCRERIADLPNVEFDDTPTPRESLLWADLLLSDCSGIIAEWLHTERPLLQLTDTDADIEIPGVGLRRESLSRSDVDQLYESGYPPEVQQTRQDTLAELGIPMDGHAGKRAAKEVLSCTQ